MTPCGRFALALLEADVHYQVAKDFIAKVKDKALGQEVLRSVTPGQQIVKIFYDELTHLLGGGNEPLNLNQAGSDYDGRSARRRQNHLCGKACSVSEEAGEIAFACRMRSATACRHRAIGDAWRTRSAYRYFGLNPAGPTW